jgi:hypothetical protein
MPTKQSNNSKASTHLHQHFLKMSDFP